MIENLIADGWWQNSLKVMGNVLYNTYERDWMEYANCPVAHPADKSFIEKPTPQQAELWATTCAQCPVFSECFDWANREGITGAYIAGEWRE